MTMLSASAPYFLAVSTLGPIADGARGVSNMAAHLVDGHRAPLPPRRCRRRGDGRLADLPHPLGFVERADAASALPTLAAAGRARRGRHRPEPACGAVERSAGPRGRACARRERGTGRRPAARVASPKRSTGSCAVSPERGRRAIPADYTPSYALRRARPHGPRCSGCSSRELGLVGARRARCSSSSLFNSSDRARHRSALGLRAGRRCDRPGGRPGRRAAPARRSAPRGARAAVAATRWFSRRSPVTP